MKFACHRKLRPHIVWDKTGKGAVMKRRRRCPPVATAALAVGIGILLFYIVPYTVLLFIAAVLLIILGFTLRKY